MKMIDMKKIERYAVHIKPCKGDVLGEKGDSFTVIVDESTSEKLLKKYPQFNDPWSGQFVHGSYRYPVLLANDVDEVLSIENEIWKDKALRKLTDAEKEAIGYKTTEGNKNESNKNEV